MSEKESETEDKDSQSEEEEQEKSKDSNEELLIGGYKPQELLEAPVKPPKPAEAESRHDTRDSNVIFFVVLGIIWVILGIVLIVLVNAALGIIIVLIGGLGIVASIFRPYRK